MRIEVYRGKDGQWYVRLRASNGQVVNVTEGYTRKGSALRAANRLPGQVARARVVEVPA